MKSYLLTEEVTKQAVSLAKVVFLEAAVRHVVRLPSIHVVIMDPVKTPECGFALGTVLYEESIGNPSKDCVAFARSKAEISWRHKMYSQVVQQIYPHLYEKGMTIWGGGVYLHGIAAGASGVQYQMDQWFAELVIITCRALCIQQMRQIVQAVGVNYIGDKILG